jgi:hypothetical protein
LVDAAPAAKSAPQAAAQTMSASPEKARYKRLSETTAPAPDWKALAVVGAWDAPSWKEAAADYHKVRKGRPSIVEIEPERLRHLRKLMDDSVSCERAWDEINRAARARYNAAPQPTVEALMYGLRDGVDALPTKPERLRRLSELNETQLHEVCTRLQNFKPTIGRPWTPDEVAALVAIWTRTDG